MSPPDPEHALLVSQIFVWLVGNGYGAEQVVVDCASMSAVAVGFLI